MVPLAVGTQTTGSTIRPASFCGIVGYRPTYGHLRCTGVKEAAGSFDTLGLMARSIADIALYRDVLLGEMPAPLPTTPGGPTAHRFLPHVAVVTPGALHGPAPGKRGHVSGPGGCQGGGSDAPGAFEDILDLHRVIASFEFARNLTYEIAHHWEQLSPALRQGRVGQGLACRFETYRSAQATLERCRTSSTPSWPPMTCCSPPVPRARRQWVSIDRGCVLVCRMDRHACPSLTCPCSPARMACRSGPS